MGAEHVSLELEPNTWIRLQSTLKSSCTCWDSAAVLADGSVELPWNGEVLVASTNSGACSAVAQNFLSRSPSLRPFISSSARRPRVLRPADIPREAHGGVGLHALKADWI